MLPVHQCRTSSYLRHLAVRVLRHRIWHLRPDAVNKGSLVGFFTLQKLRRKAGVGCSDDLPPCPNDQVSMTLRRGPARLLHFAQIVCTSQRIDTSSWVLARMQILPSTRSCVTPIIPVARENRSPSDCCTGESISKRFASHKCGRLRKRPDVKFKSRGLH